MKYKNKILFLTLIYWLGNFSNSNPFDFGSIKNWCQNSIQNFDCDFYKMKAKSFYDFYKPEIKKFGLYSVGALAVYYGYKTYKNYTKKSNTSFTMKSYPDVTMNIQQQTIILNKEDETRSKRSSELTHAQEMERLNNQLQNEQLTERQVVKFQDNSKKHWGIIYFAFATAYKHINDVEKAFNLKSKNEFKVKFEQFLIKNRFNCSNICPLKAILNYGILEEQEIENCIMILKDNTNILYVIEIQKINDAEIEINFVKDKKYRQILKEFSFIQ